jgi:hypothetical protein
LLLTLLLLLLLALLPVGLLNVRAIAVKFERLRVVILSRLFNAIYRFL